MVLRLHLGKLFLIKRRRRVLICKDRKPRNGKTIIISFLGTVIQADLYEMWGKYENYYRKFPSSDLLSINPVYYQSVNVPNPAHWFFCKSRLISI